jgi:hypothetical protein
MAETITHELANADVKDQDFDGGLNLKSDPASIKPPQTTRADNAWYVTPGQVRQLPAFATQGLLPGQAVYNMGTRDTLAPSSGDVLICAESGPPTAQTQSRWYHNAGKTLTRNLSAPPYTLLTRPHATSVSPTSNGNTFDPNLSAPMFARQEIAVNGRTAWATFCVDATAGLRMQSCYADTLGDIAVSNPVPVLSVTQAAVSGVASQSYCAVATAVGTALTCSFFNFDGTVNKAAITQTLGYGETSSSAYVPFDFVTVNNVTYCIYYGASGTLYAINCVTGQSVNFASGVGSAVGPFCAFAATTHQTSLALNYFFVCTGGKLYAFSVSATGVFAALGNVALPVPAYPSSSTGFLYATGCANIVDTSGGTGPNAAYAVSVFHSYNERLYQTTATTALGDFCQVSASQVTWSAQAGFGTMVANPFRTISGAIIAAKAFCAAPPEANFQGPTQSRAAYCVVRCGSTEPLLTNLSQGSYGQPTYFLIDHQGGIAARFGDNQGPVAALYASTYNATNTLPLGHLNQLSCPFFSNQATAPTETSLLSIGIPSWYLADARYAISLTVSIANQPPYVIVNPTPLTPKWLPQVALFSVPTQLSLPPCVQQGPSAILSGPMTLVHDGAVAVEAGYHFATNNPILVAAPTISGGIYTTSLGGNGTYLFVSCWRWIDALGRVHRSAPSVPVTLNVSQGNYYGSTFYVPLPLSQRTLAQTQPVCELYRTVVNATDGIYYLVNSGQGSGWYGVSATSIPLGTSAPGAPSFGVSLNDVTITNQNLTAQPRLYTAYNANAAASTYVATAPPPFVWQTAAKNRVFGLACTQGQWRLYYSAQSSFGIAPEFNYNNYAPVPLDLGTPRSLEAMDDKVLVFGSSGIAVMNGDGPPASNAAGVPNPGDGFSQVVPLPQPVGAYGAGSPVRLPTGVIYQSTAGIQMVGRDLAQTPVGAPIDPLAARQVGGAGQPLGRGTFISALQAIVWANTQGAPLVYTYLMQKWSTWPLLQGALCLCQKTDGTVYAALQPVAQGQILSTADVGILGQAYTLAAGSAALGTTALVLETPWIAVGTTSYGEGELWEMQLGGAYLGPHTLLVEQAYNYGPYSQYKPAKSFVITQAPPNYQFRIRPQATSRIWTVRYRFTVSGNMAGSAYNLACLSDMVLFFATKQGATRLSAASSR